MAYDSSLEEEEAVLKNFRGFELLYTYTRPTIRKKSDIMMLFLHFVLWHQLNLNCLGTAEQMENFAAEKDELLTCDWNANNTYYTIYYAFEKKIYKLCAHCERDNQLNISLVDVKDEKGSWFALNISEFVMATKGDLKEMLPRAEELAKLFHKNLIRPVIGLKPIIQKARESSFTTSLRTPRDLRALNIRRVMEPDDHNFLRPRQSPYSNNTQVTRDVDDRSSTIPALDISQQFPLFWNTVRGSAKNSSNAADFFS